MANPRYGHPYFYELTEAIQILHENKNRDYAIGGHPLGNFQRVSAILQTYPHMDWSTPEGVAVVYMLKQIDAYLWMKSQGHQSTTGEGIMPRLKDVMIYAGILSCIEKENIDNELRHPKASTTPTECVTVRDAGRVESTVPRATQEHQRERDSGASGNTPGRYDHIGPSPAPDRLNYWVNPTTGFRQG